MSDLHAAAERWLTRALSHAMGSVPGVAIAPGVVLVSGAGGGAADPDEEPMGLGGVLALEAIGALSAGEAAIWRQRFELARGGPPPVEGPEAAAAAAEHLKQLAAEPGRLDELGAAFGLFVHTGLVDFDSLDGLLEELGLGADDEDEDDEGDDLDDLELSEGGDPVAVAPAPLARHDGLCLTCAEVRERGLAVHWHSTDRTSARLEDPDLRVTDDLGTDYGPVRGGGASWEGENGPVSGTSQFAVPVPDEARTLVVRAGPGEWAIPLPQRD